MKLAKDDPKLTAELLIQYDYDPITQRFMGRSLIIASNNEEIVKG